MSRPEVSVARAPFPSGPEAYRHFERLIADLPAGFINISCESDADVEGDLRPIVKTLDPDLPLLAKGLDSSA